MKRFAQPSFFLLLFFNLINAAEIERKEKRVRMLTGHGALLRYVLQGLVAESGLNWAADPELRRIMLTLEDPEAAGEE